MIATAKIPGHSGELRCYHHDGAYEVWVDHTELMSTRVFGSEEALAELALERLGHRRAPREVLLTQGRVGPGNGIFIVRLDNVSGRDEAQAYKGSHLFSRREVNLRGVCLFFHGWRGPMPS